MFSFARVPWILILNASTCCKMISVKYITLNATISGQDRIYPNTHLCRTLFAEYINNLNACTGVEFAFNF